MSGHQNSLANSDVCVSLTGMLLAIAIRTGSPLSLSIAEPVWKQLAGMPLGVSDLTEVDKDYVPGEILNKTSGFQTPSNNGSKNS